MNSENHKIKALEKLLNSSLIKEVYPIISKIEIENVDFEKKVMKIKIIVDSPDIQFDTVFEKGLDPAYLSDHHIHNALPFIGLDIKWIIWDVYEKSGRFILGYDVSFRDNRPHPIYYKSTKFGEKLLYF